MRKSLVTLASNGRSLMHTIRNNCGYEFVKLCLRYTARDPRLRSSVWSSATENPRVQSGEVVDGVRNFIERLVNLSVPTIKRGAQQHFNQKELSFN